ncbi:MAG: hypothetical protein ABIJ21_07880 [Nanoarchaeota archaeon]
MAINRETAKICRISDLLEGTYVIQEGWQPNYIKATIGNISRASIMGAVVSIEDSKNFHLDDGTGKILVRSFEKEQPVTTGDLILIIGRPRAYGSDIFLTPEIIKTITNPLWVDVRKEQLKKLPIIKALEKSPAKKESAKPDTTEALIAKIQAADTGDGAIIDALIDNPEAEAHIHKLLEEGRIFQNKPGHVKLL